MPDKKLTDNEIVKALECCNNCDCGGCPCLTEDGCKDIDYSVILDLITRLQEENDTLKNVIKNSFLEKTGLDIDPLAEIKSEAYKECIEKVKSLFPSDNEPYQYWEIHEGADNLLKELVGEDNGK